MDLTYDSVNKEQKRMEDERRDFEPLKRICCDLAYPERVASWDYQHAATGIAVKGKKLESRIQRVYDPTAIKAFDIWSSGIIGHYMPKDVNWFAEELADRRYKESKDIIKWLQDTDEHLRYVLRASGGIGAGTNYYTQKGTAIRDGGCIGDSFMYIERDRNSGKLFMQTCHPNEFWIRRDYWGRITAIHHKSLTTMRDLVDEYGMKALNQDQQISYRDDIVDKKDTPIILIHGVYRNQDYQPGKAGVKNMRWQHVYINVEGKHKIQQTGSRKLNPVPWSLNRPSSETYGRGVIAEMLIEILTANFIGKDILTASSVAVRPPMLMTQALRHKLDMGAGAVNFVNQKEMLGLKMGDLVARLIDSSGYPFGIDQQRYWQSMIEDRLGVSLFLALNMASAQGYKNIDHIETAKAERAVLMAPFLGTLDSVTDMDLDRVYDLELDAGNAPPIPDEIAETDGRVDIHYIGPINQVLKQYYEIGGLMATIQRMGMLMQIDSDAAIVLKSDELARKILRAGNTPEEVINSPQDVAEIKAIAAEQAEQARQVELMAKSASAVPDLSKRIEQDSMLSQMKAA